MGTEAQQAIELFKSMSDSLQAIAVERFTYLLHLNQVVFGFGIGLGIVGLILFLVGRGKYSDNKVAAGVIMMCLASLACFITGINLVEIYNSPNYTIAKIAIGLIK